MFHRKREFIWLYSKRTYVQVKTRGRFLILYSIPEIKPIQPYQPGRSEMFRNPAQLHAVRTFYQDKTAFRPMSLQRCNRGIHIGKVFVT